MPGYFSGCTGYTWAYGQGPVTSAYSYPGGTGSIFPGEYGEVPAYEYKGYDQWSGPRGWTQDVYWSGYKIDNVSLNDTFETWRNKTNSEIIQKLNLMKVYGVTYGDGIMGSNSTGGTAAIAFSGMVTRTHVTFCNNLNVGKSLKVAGVDLLPPASGEVGGSPSGSITGGYPFNQNLLVLDNKDDKIGCNFSGIIVGGGATGPANNFQLNDISRPESIGSNRDPLNNFVYDRPYWLHKNAKWRTKESLWLEGYLDHKAVYSGRTADGSFGEEYPNGPYGYTGCGVTYDDDQKIKGPSGGVVRIFFGPTLTTSNYLDIDGRGGSAGATGMPWCDPMDSTNNRGFKEIGGATGALVISNSTGPVLEFDTSYGALDGAATGGGPFGFTNIHRGANRKRCIKKSHGFIVGNVLRFSGITHGFVKASAAGDFDTDGHGKNAAEVIGVVSKVVNANTFDIAFSGEIVGTTAGWNAALVENHTKGLVPGCVYHLSQFGGADKGKIQYSRPSSVGYVVKPVLIATGNNTAVVVPFTGTYLSPTGCTGGGSGSGGASGDDATLIEFGFIDSQQSFKEGDIVCVDPTKGSNVGHADSFSSKLNEQNPFGVVYSVNTDASTITIATSGTISWPSHRLKTIGTYYLGENGQATQTPGPNVVKVWDAHSMATVTLNIGYGAVQSKRGNDKSAGGGTYRRRGSDVAYPGEFKRILSPTGATGYTFDNATQVNENHLINPDFGIWQRGIGVTGSYTGISQTYFADRWLRVSQTGTYGAYGNNPYHSNQGYLSGAKPGGISAGTHRTLDYKLKQGLFDKKQIDVESHPDYYAIVKGAITYHGGTNNNEYYKVEQRIPDVTSFAGNVMTASWYAKTATGTGDMLLAWIQNLSGTTGPTPGSTGGGQFISTTPLGVTANELFTPITRFRVTPNWSRYAFSFFVPEVSSLAGASGSATSITRGTTADHFAALSFYTQLTAYPTIGKESEDFNINFPHELHLANVKLERGNISTAFNYINPNEELRKCQRFYQTSYEYNIPVGSKTMKTSSRPDTSGVTFIVPGLFIHLYEFPERMRFVPTCGLISPTGIPNEGFNRDVKKDLRLVAGTKGTLGEVRSVAANSSNISCYTDTANALEIRVIRGASRLDTVTVHYFADAELNNGLPTKPVTT